jgi:hypothetical protein
MRGAPNTTTAIAHLDAERDLLVIRYVPGDGERFEGGMINILAVPLPPDTARNLIVVSYLADETDAEATEHAQDIAAMLLAGALKPGPRRPMDNEEQEQP